MILYDIHDMVFVCFCTADTPLDSSALQNMKSWNGGSSFFEDIKARAASLESQLQKARRPVLGDRSVQGETLN